MDRPASHHRARRDHIRCVPDLESVRLARRFTTSWAEAHEVDGVADDAALVVAELATNAVLHARTDFEVHLRVLDGGLRVDVCDGSTTQPLSGTLDLVAMSGRGLPLVNALAAGWGVDPREGGKCVWAHLLPTSAAPEPDVTADELLQMWATLGDDAGPAHPRTAAGPAAQTLITVPDLPAADVIAAKTHMDDLLRELQLVLLHEQAPQEAAARTPGATDFLGLARRLDTAARDFESARLQIRSQALRAVESGADRVSLELALDPALLGAAVRYRDAVEEAENLSRGTSLLTLTEALTRHAAVRRHYLDRIVRGLGGAA
ncbi:ATP-binding protein [Kineococcus glutinatus]|uniref:Histidine kinase/HSP90-like ATPase domain-containing protein n=1 Tax=Kineococcus glutinatus TaxID=1070872 RepID=A0ABP9HY79_9ACTN